MVSRFPRGSTAYAKDGRNYIVEEVEAGVVYCYAENGVETEFPESALMNDAEWAARADGRRDDSYVRLKQSHVYGTPSAKLDRAAAEKLLTRAEKLFPGLVDFVAFKVASRVFTESRDQALLAGLSIVKCRHIFDAAKPDVRACLMAEVLAARPDMLASAANLGDNLLRAMIDKGMSGHAADFEDFQDRPRR
jgi:hypothetical protein